MGTSNVWSSTCVEGQSEIVKDRGRQLMLFQKSKGSVSKQGEVDMEGEGGEG